MNTHRRLVRIGWLVGLVAVCFTGLIVGQGRSLVAWEGLRAVAFESDDWGLAGFVPQAGLWHGVDRAALAPGRFPPVYWESTLESASTVRSLAEIMLAHHGRDGVAAVWQPNYIMASMGWIEGTQQWQRYVLPDFPPSYRRPGLWAAVDSAQTLGVWFPELHGYMHYDPERRRQSAVATDLAAEVTRRGVMLFPDSEGARELGAWRPGQTLQAELDTSVAVFSRVFGRAPSSLIAPDYTWDSASENRWVGRGLTVVQAKREQRTPAYSRGLVGRLRKVLDRHWAKLAHGDRVYLERNCRLEPVQAPSAEAIVRECLAQTEQAWANGEPAIVESHRVNYAHIEENVAALGFRALGAYLDGVCGFAKGPLFLCDQEIAQLARRAVSWRMVAGRVVARNGSHSARVLVVPGGVRGPDGVSGHVSRIGWLPAGTGTALIRD